MSSFERMTYTDAIAALEKSGKKFEFPVKWGMDLQTEHERWLTEEHVGRPVVVMNYPKEIKAFYMRLNDDGQDGRRDGRAGARHRRDHRRLASARSGWTCWTSGMIEMHLDPKELLVVPRPAPLRHRAARGLRAGVRADDHLRDGDGEHPRRDPVPADAGACGVLVALLRS